MGEVVKVAVPMLAPSPEPAPVPRVLHQVWVGSPVPDWVQKNWDRWDERLSADWQIMRWTEDNRDQWPLSARLAPVVPHVVVLADLIRLEQVWKFGGVYADCDTLAFRPIDHLTGDRPSWIAPGGWEHRTLAEEDRPLNNAIFGMRPRHPWISAVWATAVDKIERGTISPFHIAGPRVWDTLWTTPVADGLEKLDHHLFPDLPRRLARPGRRPSYEKLMKMFPQALAMHTADKSWYGANHSTNNTPVFIMAVPWEPQRKQRATELADQTRGKIVWDSTHNAWETWRAVLKAVGDGPAIIVEDDVVLGDAWRFHVEKEIHRHPRDVIQFFSLRDRDVNVESHWEPANTFMMNQCYYLPEGAARSLLNHSQSWPQEHPEHPTGYDLAMRAWMRDTKRKRYWMRTPSLVQHEPWRSEINSRRPRNRQSPSFSSATATLPRIHVLWVPGFLAERDEIVQQLRDQHPDPDGVCTHEDPERNGLLRNFATALRCAMQDDHEWNLIVSDDAIPLPGWQEHLRSALDNAPADIVGLTHFGSYGKNLAAKGIPFGVSENAIWGGAAAYRSNVLAPLLELVEFGLSIGWNHKGDDGCVIVYNRLNGSKSAMCARAIFDQPQLKSTLGHGGNRRFPHLTIRDDGPAWDAEPRFAKMSMSTHQPDVELLLKCWNSRDELPLPALINMVAESGLWK
jgi:hypothetical protein